RLVQEEHHLLAIPERQDVRRRGQRRPRLGGTRGKPRRQRTDQSQFHPRHESASAPKRKFLPGSATRVPRRTSPFGRYDRRRTRHGTQARALATSIWRDRVRKLTLRPDPGVTPTRPGVPRVPSALEQRDDERLPLALERDPFDDLLATCCCFCVGAVRR